MKDPRTGIYCFRLVRTAEGMVREGVSHRYSIMTLLGIHRYRTKWGQGACPDERSGFEDIVQGQWIDNIGDLGLVVWLAAVVAPERFDEVFGKLRVDRAIEKYGHSHDRNTMELSWFLSGLSHAALVFGDSFPVLADLANETFRMLCLNQGKQGVFGHSASTGSLRARLRGRIGSFADQVYPIYAFSKFGLAFESQEALKRAERCAEAICLAQGDLGQWWWHYDSRSGKVIQRYPVYSVHQHGMAPLALFALSEATGVNYDQYIYRGLGWIDGKNEMRLDMRDSSENLIWRCQARRRQGIALYANEFAEFLSSARATNKKPVQGDELEVVYECRPYELGWLLYGLSGRVHNVSPSYLTGAV